MTSHGKFLIRVTVLILFFIIDVTFHTVCLNLGPEHLDVVLYSITCAFCSVLTSLCVLLQVSVSHMLVYS
jgi:hypothetical protein